MVAGKWVVCWQRAGAVWIKLIDRSPSLQVPERNLPVVLDDTTASSPCLAKRKEEVGHRVKHEDGVDEIVDNEERIHLGRCPEHTYLIRCYNSGEEERKDGHKVPILHFL
eukprot:475448-Prymnesium_polylepis.1